MIRAFALAVALAALSASGQAQPKTAKEIPKGIVPPEEDPRNAGTEEQRCQLGCTEGMSKCMMPCLEGDPEEAAKPENRGKTMKCVKKCAEQQEPCNKTCEAKKKK